MRTDSSSARQWLQRTGVGRLKHYHVRLMWTQALIQDGLVEVKAIATKLNIADLNTKKLSIGRRSFLMFFLQAILLSNKTLSMNVLELESILNMWRTDKQFNS